MVLGVGSKRCRGISTRAMSEKRKDMRLMMWCPFVLLRRSMYLLPLTFLYFIYLA